jgi:hypothetical protein
MDAKIARVQSAPAMRIARPLACLGVIAVVGACQRTAESVAPPASHQYRSDIENLCDALARSGADREPPGDRALTIATWLSAQLRTQDAHDYLVKIQPLLGESKAGALDAEARRVGLSHCALAAEWRTAPPVDPAR